MPCSSELESLHVDKDDATVGVCGSPKRNNQKQQALQGPTCNASSGVDSISQQLESAQHTGFWWKNEPLPICVGMQSRALETSYIQLYLRTCAYGYIPYMWHFEKACRRRE